MPTYVYETLGAKKRRFEVRQSMKEEALTHDPETGEPVRRVISGGYGYLQKAAAPGEQSGGGHSYAGRDAGAARGGLAQTLRQRRDWELARAVFPGSNFAVAISPTTLS